MTGPSEEKVPKVQAVDTNDQSKQVSINVQSMESSDKIV